MSYQERKEKEIEEFPYADIEQLATRSIERQAEAIREALRRWGVREEDIHNELLEHGYIEPKTEDDDKVSNKEDS